MRSAPVMLIENAGQLEHTVYDPAGLPKFDRMREEGYLDLVYENEKVNIYQVRG